MTVHRNFPPHPAVQSLILFFLCSYAFLWVPDLDLKLMSILHHRSILTHSVLPALLLLIWRERLGTAPVSGALVALSVHLACDALSPAIGFGQIWLPAPFRMSLGVFSIPWLLGNCVLGFWLAIRMAHIALPYRWTALLVIATSAVIGVIYGIMNENSVLAAAVSLILPSAAYRLERRNNRA